MGAVVSAIPALHPFTLPLCLLVLIMLTFVNLRGVRESGQAFMVPVIVFVVCLGAAIAIGLLGVWQSGGHPHPIVAPLLTTTGPDRLDTQAAFANDAGGDRHRYVSNAVLPSASRRSHAQRT
jgi:amino acid transporter